MSRTELVDAARAPLTVRQYFADGDPGPIVAALAMVPELVGPTLGFVGVALGPGAAPTRAKELAILRTSVRQGCSYCVDAHSVVAIDVGLSLDEIRALRGDGSLDEVFPVAAERALLGWIDALSGSRGPIDERVWSAARAHWPEHVLVELTVTVGATMFLNRFATGLELPTSHDVARRLDEVGLG